MADAPFAAQDASEQIRQFMASFRNLNRLTATLGSKKQPYHTLVGEVITKFEGALEEYRKTGLPLIRSMINRLRPFILNYVSNVFADFLQSVPKVSDAAKVCQKEAELLASGLIQTSARHTTIVEFSKETKLQLNNQISKFVEKRQINKKSTLYQELALASTTLAVSLSLLSVNYNAVVISFSICSFLVVFLIRYLEKEKVKFDRIYLREIEVLEEGRDMLSNIIGPVTEEFNNCNLSMSKASADVVTICKMAKKLPEFKENPIKIEEHFRLMKSPSNELERACEAFQSSIAMLEEILKNSQLNLCLESARKVSASKLPI